MTGYDPVRNENQMQHEKIIRKKDGSRVKIIVNFYTDSFRNDGASYNHNVTTCKKGGRKFLELDGGNSYSNRTSIERRKMREVKKETVTPDEILQVKLELWEMMKPV